MKRKSLRKLAKELGVSASYLSQVKNGKRPPSNKVLSSLLTNGYDVNVVGRTDINLATDSDFSYNRSALGNSLTVGQRTLDPSVKVRILLPQPSYFQDESNTQPYLTPLKSSYNS